MARRRMLDPGFWEDTRTKQLSIPERLLFLGMVSMADDEGRLLADPACLKARIFPYDKISLSKIKRMRDKILQKNSNVLLFSENNVEYLAFKQWGVYQKPSHPQPSKFPPPPDMPPSYNSRNDSLNDSSQKTESFTTSFAPRLGKGRVGKVPPHPGGVGVSSFKEENDSTPPFHDSGFETVRTAYERDFGLLVPLQGQMIDDALRRWPVVWIVEAMNIAVANNVRKWAYVKGILERWENEGKGNENESKQDTEFPPYEDVVAPDGHLIGVGQTIEDIRRRDREAGF